MTTPTVPTTDSPRNLTDQVTTLPAGVTPAGVEDASQDEMFASMGIVESHIVTSKSVDIPPMVRKYLAIQLADHAKMNKNRTSVRLLSEVQADLLRAQVKSYALEYNLNLSMPTENEFGDKLNAGARVTFRFTVKSEPKPKSGPVTVIAGPKPQAPKK
jgi:hypothetical protein